jgi:hypothetical protein
MPEVWNIGGEDPYTAMQVGMENARKNRLADMDLAQKIRAEAQNKALNELMKTAVDPVTGKVDINRLAGGMATGGYGQAVPGLLKEYAGLREAQGKADEQSGKAVIERMKMYRDLLPNDPAKAASWARAAHNDTVIGPYLGQIGSVEDTIAKIPTDPKEYQNWYNQMGLSVDDAIKRSTMTAAEAATKATAERNAATSEGQLAVAQGNLAVNQQRERRLASQDATLEGASILGHDALVNAATRYNIDGTLPPLGMGKAGATTRGAILDMAAQLAKGTDPSDQRLRQISNKANSSALIDLSKREAQVGSFERNFTKNADQVLKFSSKLDQNGSPIVQKWINAGKKRIAGDPDIAAFDVAIKAVVNEYTKIVSGSMGNTAIAQSEIRRVEDLLNNAQTMDQVNAVVEQMRTETENRMAGFKEEKDRLRGDISGKTETSSALPNASTNAPPANKKSVRIGRFEVTPAN